MKKKLFICKGLALNALCAYIFMGIWGCAVVPERMTTSISNIPGAFDKGTIISTHTGQAVSFEKFLLDLSGVRVVYIGETHTNQSHHDIQLRVIKSLLKKHPGLSVGMEMFDRSYQSILDLWVAGKLDPDTFLKKVHWYANWRFDFELYQGILDFIKAQQIALVGLNLPFHIPPRIAVGGIENLSDADRAYVPAEINISDAAHRAYLKKIFSHHRIRGREDFENFYMTQCVWEEVMAESVSLNLKEQPMVVLAGNGHIVQKFGIPNRAFRRTGASFRTVLLVPVGDEAERSAADYIWITPAGMQRFHRTMPGKFRPPS
jgi:uncharacterized iron-regulated protein